MQAQYPTNATLVAGGQLYIMVGPDKGRGYDRDDDRNDHELNER